MAIMKASWSAFQSCLWYAATHCPNCWCDDLGSHCIQQSVTPSSDTRDTSSSVICAEHPAATCVAFHGRNNKCHFFQQDNARPHAAKLQSFPRNVSIRLQHFLGLPGCQIYHQTSTFTGAAGMPASATYECRAGSTDPATATSVGKCAAGCHTGPVCPMPNRISQQGTRTSF